MRYRGHRIKAQHSFMRMEEALKELGERIRMARIRKGLTQSKLANMIGKDQPSLNRVERGKVNPTYIYLLEICEGLEISINELLQ